MDPTTFEWLTKVATASGPAVMVLIIYLGMKRVWIWGHHYEELQARCAQLMLERDEYKVMLFRALTTAEAVVAKNDRKE